MFERSDLPRELRPFVDDRGRLAQWPARLKVQRLAMPLLAARFESGREYSEREVNSILLEAHTFADWAILRRSLVDLGWFDREADGSRYRLRPGAARGFAAQA